MNTQQLCPNAMQTIDEAIKAQEARKAQGNWVPACGGTEQPFTMSRVRLLYCYQPSSGRHAYLNLDTDTNMSDEEVEALRR